MLCLCISILQEYVRPSDAAKKNNLGPVALSRVRRYVVPSFGVNRARVKEVLVKVVHKLEDVTIHRPGDDDVVDQAGK